MDISSQLRHLVLSLLIVSMVSSFCLSLPYLLMKRKWISPIVPNLMPHSSKLQVPRKTLTVLNQAENIDTLVRRTVVERESPPVPSTTHLQCAYYAKCFLSLVLNCWGRQVWTVLSILVLALVFGLSVNVSTTLCH